MSPALGLLILGLTLVPLQAEDLSAVIRRPIHPVLIRNEQDPVLRIAVEVPDQREISLKSFRFSLEGTTDLSDITSLQLFSTGDQPEFSPKSEMGDPVPPENSIEISCDFRLKPGQNYLWLAVGISPKASLSGRVVARCRRIETTLGELALREEPSCAYQRIGVALRKHNDDGVDTYRIPALTRSKNNSLLSVYDMRRNEGRDLQEDIDIGLSRSTDGGQTWEPTRVIMDMGEYGGLPQSQNGCSDPGIIVDHRTGDIFCFAVWMNGKPGKHQWSGDGSEPGYEIGKSAQILMVKSSDDGLTWTKPENLTRKLKQETWWLFAPAPQSGFNLSDGTLVMPV
ncbi:MAG: exo-alpha-sialidase, partial [Planctomycetaceae bacterium]|nr:exo-alpha-sialidase [Planctomycetaceae bacterium]